MKIGLPKIRFTRKLLLISVAMLALLGGSGAAALYVGAAKSLLKTSEPGPAGGACTTIQMMVVKTPAKRLWMRKYIRMDSTDGQERIRTALRIAGLMANSNTVDLVQVSVIDGNGPTLRSEMRGRNIGAEVVIALQPRYLPDMKEPFIVRYYEGMATGEGRYYGERVSLDVPEIQKLMSAMKAAPDKQDCTDLPKPEDLSADGKTKNKKPKQVVGMMGQQSTADETKPKDHGASAEEGAENQSIEAAPAKQQSFLDSVLSLVGLGGTDEKAAENTEAKAADNHMPAIEETEKPEVATH